MENVKLRLIATDDLQESLPVTSAAFTVDNRPIVGVAGIIRHAATSAPIAGAVVELRDGADAPLGRWSRRSRRKTDGAYEFLAVPAGSYTVVAAKSGYAANWVGAELREGAVTADTDVYLTPVAANGIAQSTDGAAFLRYPRGAGLFTSDGGWLAEGTYELWFKPRVAVSGGDRPSEPLVRQLEQRGRRQRTDHGVGRRHPRQARLLRQPQRRRRPNAGRLASPGRRGVEPRRGRGAGRHLVPHRSPVRRPRHGLYVNGKLQGYDPRLSSGAPEADWSDGTLGGGWVSLGDNETAQPGRDTALGWFKELRVSRVQRYNGDFTPPQRAANDADTVLLDHLIGGTSGQYHDFIWQP